MATLAQPSLFSWRDVDAASDLQRLELVLSALPDERLVAELEAARGRGRDDYPIRATWNALLAGVVFQHGSAASLLRELRRNAELREVCGFDPCLGANGVPTDDAMSRFLKKVMEHQERIEEIFHELVRVLGEELPDLGRDLAVDSTAVQSFGKPVRDEEKKEKRDGRRELDADWGTKSYRGTRRDGSAWEKVTRWFGFKIHLLVDAKYELPLAFGVTRASRADGPELPKLVAQNAERHEAVAARAETCSADKAYDTMQNYEELYDVHGITPVIDCREMWKGEKTRTLFGDRVEPFTYDERGEVYCECPATGKVRSLVYQGVERERRTLKYRCRAAAYGLECAGRRECEAGTGVGSFGRTVRVRMEENRRVFSPLPRQSYKFKRLYAKRTSVERVNARLDRVLGFELHTTRGMEKMKTRVAVALVVMLAMAVGRIRAGQRERMRSLVGDVRRAA